MIPLKTLVFPLILVQSHFVTKCKVNIKRKSSWFTWKLKVSFIS